MVVKHTYAIYQGQEMIAQDNMSEVSKSKNAPGVSLRRNSPLSLPPPSFQG